MNYERYEGENILQYAKRILALKFEEKEDIDHTEIYNSITGKELSVTECRKRNSGMKDLLDCFTDEELMNISEKEGSDLIEELIIQKRELYKEQQINRDILNEYKAYMREDSRAEGLERIIQKAFEDKIAHKPISKPKLVKVVDNKKEILVAFADVHYGADFCIKDFFGNVLNEYNKGEVINRLWALKEDIYDFAKLHNCNKLRIVDGGDSLEGKLHLSQLQALKSNVVDDIIDYADIIVEWLTEMQNDFVIDFYTSEGNHSDLRLLSGKKGDFPHENLERIYFKWLEKHFKNNTNITINANKDGLNYFDVLGFKVLTAHGQNEKNIRNSIGKYEALYNIPINYFIVGHLHSKMEADISGDKEVVQVRSIMGMNDFAEQIGKRSPAGALMFTIEEGIGKRDIREIKFA